MTISTYLGRPEELLLAAEEMVKGHMAKYDPSHDWAHVDRVRRSALRIAQTIQPPPDFLVVELAALFHDLDGKYATPASPSLSTLLSPFLSHPSLSPSQADLILRIIPSVSYTSETKLLSSNSWTWQKDCAELHAVQDADRLDAIGAVGVLRVAAFSGAKGRLLLHSAASGSGEMSDSGAGASAEGHFHEKLLRVRDRMKTAFGKEEAERRHQTMLDFLAALQREKDEAL